MSWRLSKKKYFFGLEAWELMRLIVGLEIREVNYMILLSHRLSNLEEIKEIIIDQFSTNRFYSPTFLCLLVHVLLIVCDFVSDFIFILVILCVFTTSLMSRSLYNRFNFKQRMGSIAVNPRVHSFMSIKRLLALNQVD